MLAEQRIHRNRDDAGLDGAEERGRPVDGIGEAEQDALLTADAEIGKDIAEARDPLGELSVSPAAAWIDVDGFTRAAGRQVATQDVVGEIVGARDGVGRAGRVQDRRPHTLDIHVPHRCFL